MISSATTIVQPAGPTPANDIAVNAAIPARDPVMSIAYARSGGIDLSRPPSGRASAAIAATTSANTPMSIPMFASMPGATDPPRSTSFDAATVTLSWAAEISLMTTKNSNGNGASRGPRLRRPRMMPRPMPRKLAIRMRLVKKPK